MFAVTGFPCLKGVQAQSWLTLSVFSGSWHLYKWTLTVLCFWISSQFSRVPSSLTAALTSKHFSDPATWTLPFPVKSQSCLSFPSAHFSDPDTLTLPSPVKSQ